MSSVTAAEKGTTGAQCDKKMLIIFFDIRGSVHYEFVSPNHTVDSEYYYDVLRRLKETIRRKRPDLWKNWLLHHDNAPAHTSLKQQNF